LLQKDVPDAVEFGHSSDLALDCGAFPGILDEAGPPAGARMEPVVTAEVNSAVLPAFTADHTDPL
jgi:hypothetical protein